jgi:hypothetical protein
MPGSRICSVFEFCSVFVVRILDPHCIHILKQSSLSRPSCFYHSKVGLKKCPRDRHSNVRLSGFRRYTVYHSKTQICPVFEWSTKLNYFIRNIKYFFFIKQSSLANQWSTKLDSFNQKVVKIFFFCIKWSRSV